MSAFYLKNKSRITDYVKCMGSRFYIFERIYASLFFGIKSMRKIKHHKSTNGRFFTDVS